MRMYVLCRQIAAQAQARPGHYHPIFVSSLFIITIIIIIIIITCTNTAARYGVLVEPVKTGQKCTVRTPPVELAHVRAFAPRIKYSRQFG
jgi:hypothetical protein